VIFDSDVLIWFLRGDAHAVTLIDSTADRAVSIVTWMEILQGARSKGDVKTIRDLLQRHRFRVLPIGEAIGYLAAGLIEQHPLSHGLRIQDALIAATAIENGATLATGNARHFRVIAHLEVKAFHPRR